MRFLHHLSLLAALGLRSHAQNATTPPTLSLLYSMSCDLGERFTINNPPNGKARYVIPIIGGTFKGPNISGKAPSHLLYNLATATPTFPQRY